ncbi:ankyrin repeat domain-containing protein [Roseateles sp. UC29_93]|uniref:ankyrin repeat domain-containing protein n=1 Tax=Roseateles sp. UC29_93 TaxID=3350177 RepID=UPI00366C83A6
MLLRCSKTGAWAGEEIQDLSQRNFLNDTPLHTVCSWGELEPVAVLLDHGADVNALGDHGNTVLFNAIGGRNPEVIKVLIQHGADPRIKNDWGSDAVLCAKDVSAPPAIVAALMETKKGRAKR